MTDRVSQGTREDGDSQLSGEYETDLKHLKETIGQNDDVHFRECELAGYGARAVLIFVDGMQEEQLIDTHVMQVLMLKSDNDAQQGMKFPSGEELVSYFKQNLLPVTELTEVVGGRELRESILAGHTALMVEGMACALLVGSPRGKARAITEPTSEALLRGPRLGFTEVLSDNTAMLRRQGRTEQMEIKKYVVGNEIKRDLAIVYIKNIVNPELLQEVEQRVAKIDLDYIAESGYVEQLIEDDILSPFQQAQNTERPDRVMSALMEGRIALLLDGTPFALIVPVTFSMLLQSPEDYYERWMAGSLLRMLRFIAAFMSLMIPSMYISFISFHPGLIPTELANHDHRSTPTGSLSIVGRSIDHGNFDRNFARSGGSAAQAHRLRDGHRRRFDYRGGRRSGRDRQSVSGYRCFGNRHRFLFDSDVQCGDYAANVAIRRHVFCGCVGDIRHDPVFSVDLQPSDQAGKLRSALCHAHLSDSYPRLEGLVRPCALDVNEAQTRDVEDGPQTTQTLIRKDRRGSFVYSHQR